MCRWDSKTLRRRSQDLLDNQEGAQGAQSLHNMDCAFEVARADLEVGKMHRR